jgi:carbamoyl-phosphate synthase large subunit
MLGAKLKDFQFKPRLDGYAIKVPVFSPPYGGFPNVDKSLGSEADFAFRFVAQRMKSTGAAIYFIKDLKDPFCHCEARLCGPWQRQVYGESCAYMSQ